MAGPRRTPRGMKPSVENPGQIFNRLMNYVFKYYILNRYILSSKASIMDFR